MIVWDGEVACTLTSKGNIFSGNDRAKFSIHDILCMQTFPEDYKFGKASVRYVCGMSVPPLMIKRVVQRMISCGLLKSKN